MERRRMGLNLASMLPWSAIVLPLAARMTRKAGYAFWQVLPLRGVTVGGLLRTGIPVRFIEPAWNATTFWNHLRGQQGSEGMPTKLQDPLFFPTPKKCEAVFDEIVTALNPTPIWHYPGFLLPTALVEIHPGLDLTVGDLVTRAEKLGGWKPYVLDLRHLRREGDDGFRFGPWHEALAALLPFTRLIHVQACDDGEWHQFIDGRLCELVRMLGFTRRFGYDGPFVVEFDPRAMGPIGLLPWVLAKNLRLVRERVEELI